MKAQSEKTTPLPVAVSKVLYLIETGGPGGAERMLLSLACGLKPPYRTVAGLAKPGWLYTQFEAEKVSCELVRSQRWGDLGVVANVVKMVRKHHITLIHAHEFYMNVIGAVASLLTRVPLVCTVHGKNYYPDSHRRTVLYKMVARQAGAMVAVSNDLQDFFCQATGIGRDQVRTIYNGIVIGPSDRSSADRGILQSIGIPPESLILGAVGNLYPVKGHLYLVRAMPAVLQQYAQTHAVILGRGDQLSPLKAEAEGLGVADRIHFLGYREDTAKWLEAMDIFIQPSLNEGLPLALLEAMAAGVPAVVTAVGGMPEVIVNGETGFTVAPRSSDELASAIVKLLRNRALAVSMGNAGQRQVRDKFSLDRMVAEYCDVYSKLRAR